MDSPCFYGLTNPRQVREIVLAVCAVLGAGAGGHAVDLLLETASQETHLGRYRDPTPYGAGRGLFQMDLVAFDEVRNRVSKADLEAIKNNFGFDIKKAIHSSLDSSPLLAAIFCRLFYKLIPEPIPTDLVGRAEYWKKYYNTYLGAGAAAQYIANVAQCGAC